MDKGIDPQMLKQQALIVILAHEIMITYEEVFQREMVVAMEWNDFNTKNRKAKLQGYKDNQC